MNILEIYKKYNIMPRLQEHQLKVAGVAKLICSNLSLSLPTLGEGDVVLACLLHDIGNIIKFDLFIADKFLGKFTKEDLAYWQRVKVDYIAKYGNDEHHASIEIAKELKVGERIIELIDCIGFQNGKKNAESEDFGKKICAYSDMRVWPKGVCFLEDRLTDLRVRYGEKHKLMGGDENLRLEFESGLREIEKQIFSQSKMKPEDITEELVVQAMDNLKNIEI